MSDKFKVAILWTAKEIHVLQAMFAKDQKRINDYKHVLAVSTVYLAAKDGDYKPLNAFYMSLGRNDQTSFTQWLRRTMQKNDNWPHGIGGNWLTFDREPTVNDAGGSLQYFTVKKDVMPLRDKWRNLAENKLIFASETTMPEQPFVRFYVRENREEAEEQLKLFGDGQILKALDQIVKKIEEAEEKKVSRVDDSTKELIYLMRTKIEQNAKKTAAQEKRETEAALALVKKRAEERAAEAHKGKSDAEFKDKVKAARAASAAKKEQKATELVAAAATGDAPNIAETTKTATH